MKPCSPMPASAKPRNCFPNSTPMNESWYMKWVPLSSFDVLVARSF